MYASEPIRQLAAALGLLALTLWLSPTATAQGTLDICGCADRTDSLGDFHSNDSATYPPGTTVSGANITIPLPPDGVLVFDSFTVNNFGCCDNAVVYFRRNAANTPATLLVKGNVVVASSDLINVSGGDGSSGNSTVAGVGGDPGPGGFGGGDGAFFTANGANNGGAGLGPGGGAGATGGAGGSAGVLFSVPELRPLKGGSGGGGGASTTTGNCSAGGGGGGGGAILIAANGSISFGTNGTIRANGGNGGSRSNSSCSTGGGGGSAGAIRLVASSIGGNGRLEALGGSGANGGQAGGTGVIRMEAISNSFGTNTNPVAQRLPAPSALVSPVNPTVAITTIEGAATPPDPQGYRGNIDMIVSSPGIVTVGLQTEAVPSGTDVEVTVKPQLEDPAFAQRVTLAAGDCASGVCNTSVDFDLEAGAYVIEARATFEVPPAP